MGDARPGCGSADIRGGTEKRQEFNCSAAPLIHPHQTRNRVSPMVPLCITKALTFSKYSLVWFAKGMHYPRASHFPSLPQGLVHRFLYLPRLSLPPAPLTTSQLVAPFPHVHGAVCVHTTSLDRTCLKTVHTTSALVLIFIPRTSPPPALRPHSYIHPLQNAAAFGARPSTKHK